MNFVKNNAFYFIVFFNVLLKIIFLGNAPYGFDEIVSVKDTLLEFGHVKHESEWDNNPPLYYYCLWVWHAALPISEFNSRLLSVLFVSVAIGLTYKFTKKYFDNTTAITVVVFLSFSNFLHYYAQESRAYSLVLLLAMSSTIIYFKFIEGAKLSHLFWLAVINFLLVYTHYISALVVAVQFLLYPFLTSRKKLNFYIFQSFVIFVLIGWRFTKKQYLNILGFNKKGDFWLQKASIGDLIESLKLLFGGELILAIFILVLVVYVFKTKMLKNQSAVNKYCLALGLLPTVMLFIVGIFKPVFLARYLIFTVPFFSIFVFHCISNFGRFRYWTILAVLALVVIQYQPKKAMGTDYRLIAKVLKGVQQKSSTIVINRADNILAFTYYYDRDVFMRGKGAFQILHSKNIVGTNTASDAVNAASKGSIIYLVQSQNSLFDPNNEFRKQIISNGKLLYETSSIAGIELSVIKML
jgi:uncharacterized membrane protein